MMLFLILNGVPTDAKNNAGLKAGESMEAKMFLNNLVSKKKLLFKISKN